MTIDGIVSGNRLSAEAFAQVAFELNDAAGVQETVHTVVQLAMQAVGCTYASVIQVKRGHLPEILSLTDPGIAEIYGLQIDACSDPLLAAVEQNDAVVIPDVAADTRWSPRWAEQVLAAGIRSAVHLPLEAVRSPQAVLSLYSDKPDGFSGDDLTVARILAQHASVAIATASREENLAQAVDARRLVGQAMGIIMERYDLDGERAFAVLRRLSQDSNRKLRDVAQELLDSRKLPS